MLWRRKEKGEGEGVKGGVGLSGQPRDTRTEAHVCREKEGKRRLYTFQSLNLHTPRVSEVHVPTNPATNSQIISI